MLRLVVLALFAGAAVAAVVYQAMTANHQSLRELGMDIGLRLLVVILVVGLGWFLGRPAWRTPGTKPRRRS